MARVDAVINIRQGDTSDWLGRGIFFVITTVPEDLDLTGFYARFQICQIIRDWGDTDLKTGQLQLSLTADETMTLPVGTVFGGLKIFAENGNIFTEVPNIQFNVTPLVVENK